MHIKDISTWRRVQISPDPLSPATLQEIFCMHATLSLLFLVFSASMYSSYTCVGGGLNFNPTNQRQSISFSILPHSFAYATHWRSYYFNARPYAWFSLSTIVQARGEQVRILSELSTGLGFELWFQVL